MSRAEWKIGAFTIVSYGNGIAYNVIHQHGGEFYLQGDDASDWRAEYDVADANGTLDVFLLQSLENYGDHNA